MIIDAFTEGVKLGGLVNKNQIKILVCYILNSVKVPLPPNILTEVFQSTELANYFETADAIKKLVDNSSIKIDENGCYMIQEKGAQVVTNLENTLPATVKETALVGVNFLLNMAKSEKENRVQIDKLDNGYNVTCHISGGDFDLMSLTVYVPDYEQAEIVKKNFHKNPEHIYQLLLATLTGSEDLAKSFDLI